MQFQKDRPKLVRQFVERLRDELAGQQVATLGGWTSILDSILIGEEMGIQNLFAPDSIITTGGGLKGRGRRARRLLRAGAAFFGVPDVTDSYGMTEQTVYTKRCPHGRYHVPPHMVPFVLDPDTGESLGREGTTSGRFAYFDPFAVMYWGGFISGDAVTMRWGGGCGCGRTGAYMDGEVNRYSTLRGGDDRISCAGTPQAYDNALEYILQLAVTSAEVQPTPVAAGRSFVVPLVLRRGPHGSPRLPRTRRGGVTFSTPDVTAHLDQLPAPSPASLADLYGLRRRTSSSSSSSWAGGSTSGRIPTWARRSSCPASRRASRLRCSSGSTAWCRRSSTPLRSATWWRT